MYKKALPAGEAFFLFFQKNLDSIDFFTSFGMKFAYTIKEL